MAETEFPEGVPTVTATQNVPSKLRSLAPLALAAIPGIGPLMAAVGVATSAGKRQNTILDNAVARSANVAGVSTQQAMQDPGALEGAAGQLRLGSRNRDRLIAEATRIRGIQQAQAVVDRQSLIDTRSLRNTLRDDMRPITGRLAETRSAFDKVMASPNDAAADIGLIFNAARVLDPESVVREGEFATIGNNPNLSSQFRAMAQKLKEDGTLDPQFRILLKLMVADQFKEEQARARTGLQPFRNIMDLEGLDTSLFFPPEELMFRDIEAQRAPLLSELVELRGDDGGGLLPDLGIDSAIQGAIDFGSGIGDTLLGN